MEFTVTHLTYDSSYVENQTKLMREVMDNLLSQSKSNQVLLGDTNMGNECGLFPLICSDIGKSGFIDCNIGPTFPSWNPQMDYDKILYRGPDLSLKKAIVQRQCECCEVMSSDHLYVFADFSISNNDASETLQ